MSRVFYEFDEAARLLGISVEELEEMVAHGELPLVRVGTKRRLIRVGEVEAVLKRVKNGGRLRTKREFRAESVGKAAYNASRSFGVAVAGLRFEVLDHGSQWAVGMKSKQARILVEIPGGRDDVHIEERPPFNPSRRYGEIPGDFLPRPRPTGRRRAQNELAERGVRRGSRGLGERGSGYYYAPEQAARLLGLEANGEGFWSLGEKLAWVTINDYRWIPVEAVEALTAELSPPPLDDPPNPFRILLPRDGVLRPGRHELSRKNQPIFAEPTPGEKALEGKIAELERHLNDLRTELRREKLRHAQQVREQLQNAPAGLGHPGAGKDGRVPRAPTSGN